MQWVAVKTVREVLDNASRYRNDVLYHAEKLVTNRPKRKRALSTSNATAIQKPKKHLPSRDTAKLDCDPSNGSQANKQFATSSPSCTASDVPTKSSVCKARATQQQNTVKRVSSSESDLKTNNATPRSTSSPVLNVSEVLFDDIDDSVFAEPSKIVSEQSFITISSDSSEFDPSSVVYDKANIVESTKRPGSLSSGYPNGAPYPPFMHPCLLSNFDKDSGHILGSMTITSKQVCFRAAELLRIGKVLSQGQQQGPDRPMIKFFATVNESRFANVSGHGQGLIFGDIFFPDKPPFIIIGSRTPISARRYKQDGFQRRPPVAAAVKFRARSIHSTDITVVPCESSSTKACNFEVIELQATTWEHIDTVRKMVEKDFKARTILRQPKPISSNQASPCKSDGERNLAANSQEQHHCLAASEADFDDDLPDINDLLELTST